MNNFNLKAFRFIIILVVLGFIIFSTLTFATGVKSLRGDQISPKFSSIIFGRVKILHTIKDFSPWGLGCTLLFYDYHSQKMLDEVSCFKGDKKWVTDSDVFETPLNAQVKEGDYILGYCIFNINDITVDKMGIKVFGAETVHTDELCGDIFKLCSIPANSLIYAGVIKIKFTKAFLKNDKLILETNSELTISYDDFDADLAAFQKKFPKLYEQYKDHIIKATWEDYNVNHQDDSQP